MNVDIEASDIPDEVRELIRLQDQRIRRLERAVAALLTAHTTGEELGTHGAQMASALTDDRDQRLFKMQVHAAGWDYTTGDDWERDVEPEWVWESLARDEADNAWRAAHPLNG